MSTDSFVYLVTMRTMRDDGSLVSEWSKVFTTYPAAYDYVIKIKREAIESGEKVKNRDLTATDGKVLTAFSIRDSTRKHNAFYLIRRIMPD